MMPDILQVHTIFAESSKVLDKTARLQLLAARAVALCNSPSHVSASETSQTMMHAAIQDERP